VKKAVQYGAGNIGRGFIGQLLSLSGFEVVFAELDPRIVAAMNTARRYPLRVVSESGDSETYVENVRAVAASDQKALAREIAHAELVCTAVGAAALPGIAPSLASGLEERWRAGIMAPLNVILCENLIDADRVLREAVASRLEASELGAFSRLAGFARASVGRMVPLMTDEMREGNILRIWVEPYDHLPVDADALVGTLPFVKNLEPSRPFDLWIERKLYIHNLGHAALAYLGALQGCRFIWEAVRDGFAAGAARGAMEEAATAIAASRKVPIGPLLEHVDDLFSRFANRKLGDTVERVGRDLARKLAPQDRLLGALGLCARQGLPRGRIAQAIAAALLFEDSASTAIKDRIAALGPRKALETVCGLSASDPDLELILGHYEDLGRRRAAARPGISLS
jgi:mannitol-1-phosphate 5-dehydrogenase